ncbi:hypothetical protein XPA_009664 [Xanthoria parietina]
MHRVLPRSLVLLSSAFPNFQPCYWFENADYPELEARANTPNSLSLPPPKSNSGLSNDAERGMASGFQASHPLIIARLRLCTDVDPYPVPPLNDILYRRAVALGC